MTRSEEKWLIYIDNHNGKYKANLRKEYPTTEFLYVNKFIEKHTIDDNLYYRLTEKGKRYLDSIKELKDE